MCQVSQMVYGHHTLSGYIGNHAKHYRSSAKPKQTVGSYKTARERNRI